MGTIVERKRKDGTIGYTAQIVVKAGGEIIAREARTFDRRQAASAWMEMRESDHRKRGKLPDHSDDPIFKAVIERFFQETRKEIGRTKAQCLRTVQTYPIAMLRCSEIGSAEWIAFAESLPVAPQTVGNYFSHVAPIVKIARPKWKYDLDYQALDDARAVCRDLGIITKGNKRDRRPTLEELDRLIEHFLRVKRQRPDSIPMHKVIIFAVFSARRQEEITQIRWSDYESAHDKVSARILVRDMKHPGDKKGNDTWCELVPEAAAWLESMSKVSREIFPFNPSSISSNFTAACTFLGINTPDMPDPERLKFHDLRHEGASRLAELGRTIPLIASVTGHRSWQNLQRYTHVRQIGDKYENWKWRMPQ